MKASRAAGSDKRWQRVKYLLVHETMPVLLMELGEGRGTVVAVDEVFEKRRVPVGIEVAEGVVNCV
jgi:hypothetical protein